MTGSDHIGGIGSHITTTIPLFRDCFLTIISPILYTFENPFEVYNIPLFQVEKFSDNTGEAQKTRGR